MMRKWEVIINGSSYHTGNEEFVKASQMHTAVSRCLRAHMKAYPKQRYWKAEITVRHIDQTH